MLDEPINDLDVVTLSSLEELLTAWPGSALIVSHDRYFLDRVATSILAFEGDGKVVLYPGNYTSYRSLRAAAAAPAGAAQNAPAKVLREAPQRDPAKKPLTYAERIELEGILDVIAELERRVTSIEDQLSSPELYASGAQKAKQLGIDLEAARNELSERLAR